MKRKNKGIIAFSITAIIILVAIVLSTLFAQKVNNTSKVLIAEDLRAMNYEKVTEEEEKAQNEYVKFLAFFTRDLNGDGYAEKIKGTCKDLSDSDELYIELNVLTDGYLKDGVITVNAENFTWKTAIVSDNIVNGNYIGDTTSIKLQDRVDAGSQKMLWGTISSKIGNNINDYTKESTVTLTGTHVSDDGTETPINKTVNLTVDWYGEVKAQITKTSISKNISDIVTDSNTVKFTVDLSTRENIKKLILKENVITVQIPEFNGYSPTRVTTSGNYTYDKESRTLTDSRTSIVNEEGTVTTTLARENTYTIDIEYPKEAYKETVNTISLEIPVTTYYVGYNNSNKEFENPKQSNIAKDIVVLRYSKPSGYIYDFDITVGKYGRNGYTISKEKPIQIYNGITEETVEDYYTVRWELTRGNQGNVTKVVMRETPNEYTDKFLSTSKEYTSMLDYIENIGIYFSGASTCLGDNGFINVYNDETNELIHKFNKDDWGNYTESNPYKYESGIKHIRIETSNAKQGSWFYVGHIKEINDEVLTEKISKQDFDEFSKIYSYLQGNVQIEGKSSMDSVNEVGIANYEDKVSYTEIAISKKQISTLETEENFRIYIDTKATHFNDSKWKNGQFIVKLPSEIIAANINDVTINNSNVQILGYDIYEENKNYFIKIITENEEESTYQIIIDCNITPDPATSTSTRKFELYAYNEIANNYYNSVEDRYDVNGNNNFEENVNYSSTNIDFIAPSTIITSQYISNYGSGSEIKMAPNVVEVTNEQRTANINITLLNNYSDTLSELKLIGVIPTVGNKYIVNGKELGSEFTVQMSSTGIHIPDELKDVVTVYYSEKVDTNKNLEDSSNEWTKNPDDWTKVRTYLIDFGNFVFSVSKSYSFDYEINIPEGVDYNKVSYSEHAIYYDLNTENGKLPGQTEPTKLGIKVVKKYGLNLTKYKKDTLRMVNGATYSLVEKDENGKILTSKLLTTKQNGQGIVDNLYVNTKYELKEIVSPSNYIINNDTIQFYVSEDESGNLKMNVTSQSTFSSEPIINNKENTVSVTVEDIPKYTLLLNKTSLTGEKLKNVRFDLKETGTIYRTNEEGQLEISNLTPNTTYTIVEKKANGYYVDSTEKTFELIYDKGNVKIESNDSNIKNAIIINNEERDHLVVEVSFVNEKIPTYNVQILKVAENDDNNIRIRRGNNTII